MFYEFAKRTIDIIGSLVGLVVFFPVCVIAAIAIELESPGPVLADTPKRSGKNGKQFRLLKFRSMIPNAHNLLHSDPRFKKLLEEYKKSSYKLHDDPRVTKVGKFIRKHSIDEIPQFLNVLRGEMSLVGPRAYYPFELEEQQKKYPHTKKLVEEVLKVKPGITGEWQVSGRSEINFDKRIEMDANYARKKSISYDMMIIAKTPLAMITGKGAI
ncbi:sugar transferase [Candidatus Microgenomates bacterium]|jgi:lipopolysaccharide/colanic/teichoic acid biosynthesis glycosyltransferase|nr:MAG: sugar transferase [Candidatus Microgenomates bacterium]